MQVPESTQSFPERRGWYLVVLLSLAGVVGQLDRSLLSLLVAPISRDLALTDVQMSLLLGFAFAVFMGVASLPIAWLADRRDRRWILAFGIAAWSVMTALCAFANDFGSLFLARVGVGIGEACLIPAGGALIADSFSRERLARANSVFVVGGAFGAGIALLLGGAIVQWTLSGSHVVVPGLPALRGWQSALLLAAVPGIALAALIALIVRDPRHHGTEVSAASVSPSHRITARQFIREHRAALFTLWLAYPLAAAASQGWLAWMPAHLGRTFAMDPGRAGTLFGLLIVTFGAAGTLLGGFLTDALFRRGRGDSAITLSVVSCSCLAVLGALTPAAHSLGAMLAILAPFFFFGGLMAVMPVLAMQLIVPSHLRARMIAGLLLAVTIIGGGLGPTLVALLSEHVFHTPGVLGPSLAVTAAVLCPVTAIVLYFARRPFERSLAAADRQP